MECIDIERLMFDEKMIWDNENDELVNKWKKDYYEELEKGIYKGRDIEEKIFYGVRGYCDEVK